MPSFDQVLIRPVITEKSVAFVDNSKYVFEIHSKATKGAIKEAIEKLYGVRVKKVNIMKKPGREVRFGRTIGLKKSKKKAVVTLKGDDKLEIFTPS